MMNGLNVFFEVSLFLLTQIDIDHKNTLHTLPDKLIFYVSLLEA